MRRALPYSIMTCLFVGAAACSATDQGDLAGSGIGGTGPVADSGTGPGSGGADTGAADAASAEGGPSSLEGGANEAGAGSDASPLREGGAATVTCSDTTLLFCEDFESYAPGVAMGGRWKPVKNNGSLTIDGVHARGAKGLHVTTQLNGFAYALLDAFAPPNNSFFGRMYAWVTAYPSAPDYAHFTLVEAAGTGNGSLLRPIGGQMIPGSGALLGTGSDGGPTGDWENWKTSAPIQGGSWKCFEWELRASTNGMNVWVDGVAKTELSTTTTSHPGANVDFVFPTIDRVWFGWWLYQGGSTPSQFDVWLDDIALSKSRIGC